MLREIKPKTARAARILKQREPQVQENPKSVLFLKSTSTSSLSNAVLTDLYSLKRPLAIKFTKKNAIHPFEDASSLEFFSQKNDASLICFGSHSKKRPHNLTLVRTFDSKILDMVECLVEADTARLMNQFGGTKPRVGVKPLLSFSGPYFADDSEASTKFRLAKSILLDFFHGATASQVDVEGLQTFISFTGSEVDLSDGSKKQLIHMRVWRVVTKRSGHKMPRIELEEIGPRLDLRLGRAHDADETLLKESMKRSKLQEAKTRKNVETDQMGDKVGRLHLLKQDLSSLQSRKMKGLKRHRDGDSPDEAGQNTHLLEESASSTDDEGRISFIDESDEDESAAPGRDTDPIGEGLEAETTKRRRVV